jgi:hypothetical protein
MLKEKFQSINKVLQSRYDLQNEINDLAIRIQFRLRGAPTFSINLSSGKLDFVEGTSEDTDVIIEGDFPIFSSAVEGRIGLGGLVKSLFRGKLRVKKGKLKIFKLIKVLRVFKTALSTVKA